MTPEQVNLAISVLAFPAFIVATFLFHATMNWNERRKTIILRGRK